MCDDSDIDGENEENDDEYHDEKDDKEDGSVCSQLVITVRIVATT